MNVSGTIRLVLSAAIVVACGLASVDASTISQADVRNYWGAEDGSGTNVNDSAGDMDATLWRYDATGTLPTFTTSAKVGNYALQFNITKKAAMDADLAFNSALTTNGYSYAVWINPISAGEHATGGYGYIFQTRGDTKANEKGLSILLEKATTAGTDGDPNTVNLYASMAGSATTVIKPDVITLNQWSHIVVTRSALDVDLKSWTKVYVNGVEAISFNSLAFDNRLLMGNAGKTTYQGFNREFDGRMDEMILFNRELSAAEVSQFYGVSGEFANLPVPEPSTLALLAAGLVGLLAYAWRKRK